MTVYADEAFLLNGAVDYLLLICAAKLGGGRIARLRLLAAALFGGLYAAAALFAPLGVLQGLPMKLVSLVIMLLIAFGAGRQTLRTGLLFLAAVCAFAGAAVLAAQLFGTGVLVLPGGTFYAVIWASCCWQGFCICSAIPSFPARPSMAVRSGP